MNQDDIDKGITEVAKKTEEIIKEVSQFLHERNITKDYLSQDEWQGWLSINKKLKDLLNGSRPWDLDTQKAFNYVTQLASFEDADLTQCYCMQCLDIHIN